MHWKFNRFHLLAWIGIERVAVGLESFQCDGAAGGGQMVYR